MSSFCVSTRKHTLLSLCLLSCPFVRAETHTHIYMCRFVFHPLVLILLTHTASFWMSASTRVGNRHIYTVWRSHESCTYPCFTFVDSKVHAVELEDFVVVTEQCFNTTRDGMTALSRADICEVCCARAIALFDGYSDHAAFTEERVNLIIVCDTAGEAVPISYDGHSHRVSLSLTHSSPTHPQLLLSPSSSYTSSVSRFFFLPSHTHTHTLLFTTTSSS